MGGGNILIYGNSSDPSLNFRSIDGSVFRHVNNQDALFALAGELTVQAVVIDIGPATIDRLAIVAAIRSRIPGALCIVCAHPSTEAIAVAALREGVDDYLRAPADRATLNAIARSLGDRPRDRPGDRNDAPSGKEGPEGIVGQHASTRKFVTYLERVSATPSTVLITGETGTGKEVAARYIHTRSNRRNKPFISVNCAAIPDTLIEAELFGHERGAFTGAHTTADGKFHHANGGTLFLDEIADLTPFAQAKILRVLETREVWRLGGSRGTPVDVRIIAATNQNLQLLVDAGRFRADLFYRLDVARMELPPLRERRSDIPLLVKHYVHQMNVQFDRDVGGFTAASMERLESYDWPGNIRELKNLVEATFIELPRRKVNLVELPETVRQRLRIASAQPPNEAERLIAALEEMHWNVSRTAARLHLSRMTVYRKLAKLGLSRKGVQSTPHTEENKRARAV